MLQDLVEANFECIGVGGTVWKVDDAPYRSVAAIRQKFGLCEIVARILAVRQIPWEEIRDFLFPTLKVLLHDPFHLLDMHKAVARISAAIQNGENIAILGDYDVDGATSSAMLSRYFQSLGVKTRIYIPDRVEEGYGPNTDALLHLHREGYSLCITVDCGTVAHEPISAAKSVGLDVIVVDHHIAINALPEAVAVVNPNRLDESSQYTYLSAVGTSFLLLVALHKTLSQQGEFFEEGRKPDLMNYLDLVALGTVCDVMPMVGLNRALVKQGLKVMAARTNMGFRALTDAIGIEESPSVYQLGFLIGPHINAGGRIGNSSLGAQLLSSDDEIECIRIADTLIKLNTQRKELENRSLEEAMLKAERCVSEGKNIIMVSGNWHIGIIGIVAGRLKERFYLPSIVISLNDNIGKASARSVSGIDIGAAVLSAKLEGLIPEGGGHEMAAGFSIHAHQIDVLYEFFLNRFKNADIQKVAHACGVLSVDAISHTLWQQLQLLEPFGPGNPEPRFILRNVEIRKTEIIADSHVRCSIYSGNSYVKGICFKCVGTEVALSLLQQKCVSLLGKVSVNRWKGREYIQFVIDDVSVQ